MSGQLGSSLHTPDQAVIRCWRCRSLQCIEDEGRCLGRRCTCDHWGEDQQVQEVREAPKPPPEPRAIPLPRVTRASRAQPGGGRQRVPEERRREVVEQGVREGPAAAAKAGGVGLSTLYLWAQEFGVSFPRRPRPDKYPPTTKLEAVNMAHTLGSGEASKRTGIHRSVITRWAVAQGRPLTGRPGPRATVHRRSPWAEIPIGVDPKAVAECCVAATLPDGRPPIGFCGPDCERRS